MGNDQNPAEYRAVNYLPQGCRAMLARRGERTIVLLSATAGVTASSPDVIRLVEQADAKAAAEPVARPSSL